MKKRDFLKKASAAGIAGIIASGAPPAYSENKRLKKTDVSLEQALEVHNSLLIFDGHNDMPVQRVQLGERPLNWEHRDPAYHTDIPRMKESNYGGSFFIVGNGPKANAWVTTELMLEDIERFPDDLMLVRSSADMIRARKAGKIGIIMSIEGVGAWIDGNIETLRMFYRLGVRLAGISAGGSKLMTSNALYRLCTIEEREEERKNGGRLEPLGVEVLKVSNELGIVTDLSHITDKAFYEVLELSSLPPIMSHTAVYALCNHSRCMTDDQLRALADAGGVAGIAFAPQFIHPDQTKATIDLVTEHICYVRDLVGIDHVGIGSDFDGLGKIVPVIPEVSQIVHLTRSMLAYGMTVEDIRKVWGGNYMRILKTVVDRA